MKQIIDGKTYNTDTAALVCELDCRAYRGDFGFHDTALYRSPKGQFFLAGEGGPASMWARPVPNGHIGGSGMRLVSTAEARQIMEAAGCDESDFVAVGLQIEEG